jgi:TatA/E family protein of Tat protein translocase
MYNANIMKHELIMGILLMLESPIALIVIAAGIFLLFGGSKLPQLAKALGQSKRSFKEGLAEAADLEAEQKPAEQKPQAQMPSVTSAEGISDEELFAEAERRSRLRQSQAPKAGDGV